jgi:hypothetical protein
MRSRSLKLLLSALAISSGVSCASPEGQDQSAGAPAQPPGQGTNAQANAKDDSVLAQVEVGPGHTVKFFTTTVGGVVVMENRPSGTKSVIDANFTDMPTLWKRLLPDQPLPRALIELQARVLARSLLPRPDEAATPRSSARGGQPAATLPAARTTAGGVTGTRQALFSSSSAADFVNSNDGCMHGNVGTHCRVNWSNGFVCDGTSDYSRFIVDNYSGNGFSIHSSDWSTPQWIYAGNIQTYVASWYSRWWEIHNASGDSFHAGCRFYN